VAVICTAECLKKKNQGEAGAAGVVFLSTWSFTDLPKLTHFQFIFPAAVSINRDACSEEGSGDLDSHSWIQILKLQTFSLPVSAATTRLHAPHQAR